MATQSVTEKILADAKKESKDILDKYKHQAAEIKNNFEKRIAIKQADIEAEVDDIKKVEIMRMISQKRLEFNKQLVLQKRNLIKSIIEESLEKLADHKQYVDFLQLLIKKSGEKDGELIINTKDWKKYGSHLEKFFTKEKCNFKIIKTDDIIGGVVIKKEKKTYLGSLDLTSELLSDELSIAVTKSLH
jgi:vacuolar-type H+-ATPase subunit E/Vma4